MDISVCMERSGPCEVLLNVFQDTRLPKPLCNWKTDFVIKGMVYIMSLLISLV